MAKTFRSVIRGFATAPADAGLHYYGDRADQATFYAYPVLHTATLNAAAEYAQHGIAPGSRVILPFDTSLDAVVSFLALLERRALVFTVKPRGGGSAERYAEFIHKLAAKHRADFIVGGQSLANIALRLTRLPLAGFDPARRAGALEPHDEDAGDNQALAFVQFSSGSTSEPKGVPITHDILLRQLALLTEFDRRKPGEAGASWLPLFHDMGLIGGLLSAMYAHLNLHLWSPRRFLADPLGWLKCLSTQRITRFAQPNFGMEYLLRAAAYADRETLESLRFDQLEHVFLGAEPIDPTSLTEFVRFMSARGMPPTAVQPSYGMAEAVLMATGGRDAPPRIVLAPNGVRCVSVGKPLPGFELRLVDAAGEPVPDGSQGEVLLRGGTLARCYFESEQPLLDAEGYYRTQDTGFIDGGELFILGRLGDRIKLLGETYHAHDFERLVDALPGVRPRGSVVLQVGVELTVLIEALGDVDHESLRGAVRRVIAHELGIKVRGGDVLFLKPRQIQRTSSGKIQRAQMLEALKTGSLLLATANESCIERSVN